MIPAIQTLSTPLADGRLRFANRTMQAPLPARMGEALRHAAIAAAPGQVLDGRLALPHGFATGLIHEPRLTGPEKDLARARRPVHDLARRSRDHDGSGR